MQAWVMALYGVITPNLDLSAGGLADSWSRRPVFVGSPLTHAVAFAVMGFRAAGDPGGDGRRVRLRWDRRHVVLTRLDRM
jgi:hypothetical protein